MVILDHHRPPGTRALAGYRRPHTRSAACRRLAAPAVLSSRPVAGDLPTLLVSLPAHVDESNAHQIRATLMAAADRRPRVLIVDMSGTRCCDWAGASALASTFSHAASRGTELRLVLTDKSVRRVISLNGLDQVLPIFADVTTAAQSG